METLIFKYKTDEESAVLLNRYRREITSVDRVFYNILCDEPELDAQFSYQKKGSKLINKFNTLNHVELINSYLMQCCIVKSYASVKANNGIKKNDQERRIVLVKQIKQLNEKLKKTTSKQTHKRNKIEKKIHKKQSQITAIDNKKKSLTVAILFADKYRKVFDTEMD